jgi:hypothetical protein
MEHDSKPQYRSGIDCKWFIGETLYIFLYLANLVLVDGGALEYIHIYIKKAIGVFVQLFPVSRC